MSSIILDASSMSEKEMINQWIFHACRTNNVPELYNNISWSFDNRLTRCIGKAFVGVNMIKFSAPLWPRADMVERKNTVIHEACHIIAFRKYGHVKSHGHEWKHCMRQTGEIASRCHSIDRTGLRRQVKRYIFSCSNCDQLFNLTTAKYNSYLKYATIWRHLSDNGELKFTGKSFVTE